MGWLLKQRQKARQPGGGVGSQASMQRLKEAKGEAGTNWHCIFYITWQPVFDMTFKGLFHNDGFHDINHSKNV